MLLIGVSPLKRCEASYSELLLIVTLIGTPLPLLLLSILALMSLVSPTDWLILAALGMRLGMPCEPERGGFRDMAKVWRSWKVRLMF